MNQYTQILFFQMNHVSKNWLLHAYGNSVYREIFLPILFSLPFPCKVIGWIQDWMNSRSCLNEIKTGQNRLHVWKSKNNMGWKLPYIQFIQYINRENRNIPTLCSMLSVLVHHTSYPRLLMKPASSKLCKCHNSW